MTEELRQALQEQRGRPVAEEVAPSSPPRVFPMPFAQTRIQPQRVLETAAAKRNQSTRHPYDPRKNKGRGPGRPREYNRPPKHKFVMGLADLITIPNIAARLKAPEKVGDKVLGPKPDAWCEFHQSFGHTVDSCLALGYQLDDLVKSGFLNDYLLDRRTGGASSSQPAGGDAQQHECPLMERSTPSQEVSRVVDAPHHRGRNMQGL